MLPGRAVAAASDTVLHFSYGANMASGILAKRGVKPLASRPAVLTEPATMISFCHRGGFATLVKQPLNARDEADPRVQRTDVHGVLHTLARADMAALQRAETGYTLQPISVRPYQRGTELVLSNHAPGGASRTEKSVELPLVSHAKSFSRGRRVGECLRLAPSAAAAEPCRTDRTLTSSSCKRVPENTGWTLAMSRGWPRCHPWAAQDCRPSTLTRVPMWLLKVFS